MNRQLVWLLRRQLWTTRRRRYALRSRLIWLQVGSGRYALTPLGLINSARRALGRELWRIQA